MDQLAVRGVHNAAFGGDAAEARLVDDLRADGAVIAALSIVAVLDGDVIGHVVCSRASIADHVIARRPCYGFGGFLALWRNATATASVATSPPAPPTRNAMRGLVTSMSSPPRR